ncbi:chromate transporter [Paenibacillus sp. YN15]|uniref:chromate transporter n=1 Tax=Paenibacillus sp. YN15 TaxID=1742774 RepID=UPI000DCE9160|nr:chromate transporter [Paenibacillus sp. YN15]RAU94034.1 chromate transporter [Paenibacillus sp. YN15]
MELWALFQTFFVIGLLSFGGGYAMIPVIAHQVEAHKWMTNSDFTDIIAVAGMSPGPIGTNSAIFVGYRVEGLPGAIAAAAGMTLPSFLIIIAVAAFFAKMNENRYVQAAFYGLRAAVTGLILYGAVRFADSNGMIGTAFDKQTVVALVIFVGSMVALLYYKVHPLRLIVVAGLVGMAVYG